jgi:heat-inducible transcriptional repressor
MLSANSLSQLREMSAISERHKEILKAVVGTYVLSAEPVGSKTLVERHDMGISSATARKVMADLEQEGYLRRSHISSGRIPTDRGYRLYVNSLMTAQDLPPAEKTTIQAEVDGCPGRLDDILGRTSKLLSRVSKYAAVVSGPRADASRLARLEVVRLGSRKMLIVCVDELGNVRSDAIDLDEDISHDDAHELSSMLNDILGGVRLGEIETRVKEWIGLLGHQYSRLAGVALEVADRIKPGDFAGGKMYLEGAAKVLEQPEFHDLEKVRLFLGALEEKETFDDLFPATDRASGSEIRIVIGSENGSEAMRDCSLVAKVYGSQAGSLGFVCVVGPTRMRYERITSVVGYTAEAIDRALRRLVTVGSS